MLPTMKTCPSSPGSRGRIAIRSIARIVLCIAVLGHGAVFAAEHDFFETKVRPVLADHCYSCHSAQKADGGLRLDTAEGFRRGGSRGESSASASAGHALLLSVVQDVADFEHPANQLTDAMRADLHTWIQRGATWPPPVDHAISSPMAEFVAKARRNHWAFQPVSRQPVPGVEDPAGWAQSPIDSYVLARLNKANMEPSAQARPQQLIRRMYYDLVGLPPSYTEVQDFLADHSPQAIEKVIDTLLASPHYGERWGRYWLDVARYSDTKGYGQEAEQYLPFSYTYRDYVIRAHNEDLPFDEFILQQLAADQLDLGEDSRPLSAMGFITVGRQFPGDRNATLDDQIDVVMRGFQGLTVSCARCHDHKFDPIPIADYYSLYGVFRSSHQPDNLPIINDPDPNDEDYRAYKAELDKLETALSDYLDSLTPEQQEQPEFRQKIAARRAGIEAHHRSHPGRPDRAMVLADTEPLYDPYVFKRGKESRRGDDVPRRMLAVLANEDHPPFETGSGRLDLARLIASKDNPLTARVFVNRVWMHHFGQPLVSTPSDFGYQGEEPTHPELLDYLARTFVEDGWSLKRLHKRIMMSSTYQQSSAQTSHGMRVDPENELLWRYKRRRLDFEALRDSLLIASDRLDRTMGGHSQDMTNPPYSTRRAVYAEIDRQNLPSLFSTFDFPLPSAHNDRRFETTVPQQALYLLNNAFVAEQARAIAEAALAEDSIDQKIQRMYRNVFGRYATPPEVALGQTFIDGATDIPPLQIEMLEEKSDWLYGYGSIDVNTGQTRSFTEFPYWSGEAYQGDEHWPDGKLGWAKLVKHGGHPGNTDHAVIRRWVSPVDSTISFVGELHHFSPAGNGIKAYAVSSREGIIWSGEVQDGFILTEFEHRPVREGDTIDLIVSSNGEEAEDRFRWHPRLFLSGEDAVQYPKQDWLTRFDFKGPTPPSPEPLDPWAQYAQVLLMSNEFVYID